jgi:hypothetical protein
LFHLFLEAVGSIDDGRLEQLFTRISALIPQSGDCESVRELLCNFVFSASPDFRVLSVAVRLLGLLGVTPDDKLSDKVRQLLFHVEPLVRLAALSCLLSWDCGVDLSANEWQGLLDDDSIYVQQKSRTLFANSLVKKKCSSCYAVLRAALDGTRDWRTVLCHMVCAVVAASPSGPSWVEQDLGLVKRVVEEHFMNARDQSALKVLEVAWKRARENEDNSNEKQAADWLDRLVFKSRFDDAVVLCKSLASCGFASLVQRALPSVTGQCRNMSLLLGLFKETGKCEIGVSYCLKCLSVDNRKCFLASCKLLAEWQVPVASSQVVALLADSKLTSQTLGAVLRLNAAWCEESQLIAELERLLRRQDPWMSVEVWDCVAGNRIIQFVSLCVESILGLSGDDSMMAHAWEVFAVAMGPEHPLLGLLMDGTLKGHGAVACAIDVFVSWKDRQQHIPRAIEMRVTELAKTCLSLDDDWLCVLAAFRWVIACDYEARTWTLWALHHWARPVRAAARDVARSKTDWNIEMSDCASDADDDSNYEGHLLEGPSTHPLECCD